MPIASTALTIPGIRGYVWTIADEEELARLVAKVYVGHERHVEKILRQLADGHTKPPSIGAVESAKKLLTRTKDDGVNHRDGLLFQTISWIVAHKEAATGSVIRFPHLQRADKGFDGLQIVVAGNDTIAALVIFEDKATSNSRGTIRDDVWPSFQAFEAGERENELMQGTTALLDRAENVNRDKIIENIVWEQIRRYRLSITGEQAHTRPSRFKSLMKGYEAVAPGGAEKRTAAVLCFDDLRAWMESFAKRVEQAIDKEKAGV